MPKLIDAAVLAVLDRSTTEGNTLFLPKEQLERPMYEAVNKVLQAAGGKWNQKAGGHVFEADAGPILEGITLTGLVTDIKREFDAFFTPPALAKDMVKEAEICDGHRVLEPNAGRGALAMVARSAGGSVLCVEMQAQHADFLRQEGFAVVEGDFLRAVPETGNGEMCIGQFDRIVMNPPFSKRQDIRHVVHAFGFLKPGGKLVAIMSASVEFRTDAMAADFRALVAQHGGTIRRLPEGAFKSSGTAVNTVMVSIPAAL